LGPDTNLPGAAGNFSAGDFKKLVFCQFLWYGEAKDY